MIHNDAHAHFGLYKSFWRVEDNIQNSFHQRQSLHRQRQNTTMAGKELALFLLGVIAIAQGLVVLDPAVPAVGPGTYPKHCGPVCRMHCPQGFVLDQYGCPICRCRDSPYQCPLVNCYNQCPYGYIYRNGCQTCECNIVDICQDRCQRYCQGPREGLVAHGCACNCQDYVRPTY